MPGVRWTLWIRTLYFISNILMLTKYIIKIVVAAVWKPTHGEENAQRASVFLRCSHSPCKFCSLGMVPRKQLSPSVPTADSPQCGLSHLHISFQLRYIITELWQHWMTLPWPLTSDQTLLLEAQLLLTPEHISPLCTHAAQHQLPPHFQLY